MESYAKAIADYEHLLQMEPNNKKAQLELNALRKKKLPREELDGASSSSQPAKKGRRIQIKEVDGSSSEDGDDGEAAKSNNTPSSNSQASPSPPPNLNSEPPPAAVPLPMPPAVKALKDEGNDLFQRGQYGDAILLYTRAIELLLDDGKCWSVIHCGRTRIYPPLSHTHTHTHTHTPSPLTPSPLTPSGRE